MKSKKIIEKQKDNKVNISGKLKVSEQREYIFQILFNSMIPFLPVTVDISDNI